MSWVEYEPEVVETWQRSRREYLRRSRPSKIVLASAVVTLVIVFILLPRQFALVAVGMIVALFAALFIFDMWLVRRYLICPNCGRCPLFASRGSGLVSSSNPVNCYHCGKRLRPPAQ